MRAQSWFGVTRRKTVLPGLVFGAFVLACSGVTTSGGTPSDDAGSTGGAAGSSVTVAPTEASTGDAGSTIGTAGSSIGPAEPDAASICDAAWCPEMCNGTLCNPGQVCCMLDGKCIDQANAATACAKPDAGPPFPGPCSVGSTTGKPARHILCGGGARSVGVCASNADCGPTEYCYSPLDECLGAGYCYSRFGETTYLQETYGCDGRCYPNHASAALAGVRVRLDWACSDQ